MLHFPYERTYVFFCYWVLFITNFCSISVKFLFGDMFEYKIVTLSWNGKWYGHITGFHLFIFPWRPTKEWNFFTLSFFFRCIHVVTICNSFIQIFFSIYIYKGASVVTSTRRMDTSEQYSFSPIRSKNNTQKMTLITKGICFCEWE